MGSSGQPANREQNAFITLASGPPKVRLGALAITYLQYMYRAATFALTT